MNRFEFGSPAWVVAVHGIVEELLTGHSLSGISYSLSEEFLNPPDHLQRYAPLGWHMIVENEQLTLGHGPLDKADRQTVADYETVRPLATLRTDGDGDALERLQKLAIDAINEGLIKSTGEASSSVFPPLAALHDRIAEVTLDE